MLDEWTSMYFKLKKSQREKIKELAKEAKCSASHFILHRVLDIPLVENKMKIYVDSARKYEPKYKKTLSEEE